MVGCIVRMICINIQLTISSSLERLAELCKRGFFIFRGIFFPFTYLFWIGHKDRIIKNSSGGCFCNNLTIRDMWMFIAPCKQFKGHPWKLVPRKHACYSQNCNVTCKASILYITHFIWHPPFPGILWTAFCWFFLLPRQRCCSVLVCSPLASTEENGPHCFALSPVLLRMCSIKSLLFLCQILQAFSGRGFPQPMSQACSWHLYPEPVPLPGVIIMVSVPLPAL